MQFDSRLNRLELVERQRLLAEHRQALDALTYSELEAFVASTGGPDFDAMTDAELQEFANAETILPSLGELRREIAELEKWLKMNAENSAN